MKKQLIAAAIAAFGASMAHAGPADHIFTPNVEYGEREIEFSAGSFRDHGKEDETAGVLTFGMGVTQFWFTEIGVEYERERGESFRREAFEWENKFQLTEPGQYFIDLGALVEIERPRDHDEGWELKIGLLTQKDFDKVQLNFNLLAERHYDSEEKSRTEVGYQWQAKYRWMPQFEVGLQGLGVFGNWGSWERNGDQEHSVGPAIFGKIQTGGRTAIKYNAAYLVGLTKPSPDHTLRATVEFEF
ncbi:hypothetical protein [Azoarcus sp. KH32C]|uniref:hypothetical protein n=1 Tax=Azoarcus sp. KH32C TaxID=748247 RepID=UPI00034D0838|nr:hypothetical protein [Azoarcus sp. KH32C]